MKLEGKVPLNPFRIKLAEMYMERVMLEKEMNDGIKKAVNGGNGTESKTLDFYVNTERMLNQVIQLFMSIQNEIMVKKVEIISFEGTSLIVSNMLGYVSYEIIRLTTPMALPPIELIQKRIQAKKEQQQKAEQLKEDTGGMFA